jgi:hypothetical protein
MAKKKACDGHRKPFNWRRRESNPRLGVRKTDVSHKVTKSAEDTLSLSLSRESSIDPDLAFILDRWAVLPAAIRAGILAMVRASGK